MLLKRKINGEFAAPGVITFKFALNAKDVGLMICTEIGQEIGVRQRCVVRQGNRVCGLPVPVPCAGLKLPRYDRRTIHAGFEAHWIVLSNPMENNISNAHVPHQVITRCIGSNELAPPGVHVDQFHPVPLFGVSIPPSGLRRRRSCRHFSPNYRLSMETTLYQAALTVCRSMTRQARPGPW